MIDGGVLVREYHQLIQSRQPLNQYWSDAFKFSYPLRGQQFGNNSDLGINQASNDKSQLLETTGKDSVRLLASSMLSGLTPANMQWFGLMVSSILPEDVPKDYREWLEGSATNLFKLVHSSNYDAEAYEFMLDMVIGGMCGLFCDLVDDEFKFEFWSLDSLYVKDTLRAGKIDTVFRPIVLSGTQAKVKFGINSLPQCIKSDLQNNNGEKTYKFIRIIRPRIRKGKVSTGKLKKSLPFESLYVHEQSKTVVHESGFHEFPVVIPRWLKIPNSDYAVGPFDDALPDVKTINRVVEMMLTNADMAIAGTFVAKDDGVLNPNTMRIGARKVIMAMNPDNIKPLATGGDFRIATAEIDRLQRNIRKILMSDQLAPQSGPAMTATEVNARINLIRQLLGPIYGRFHAEFLQPLITRVFGLAFRAGLLGQPPEGLEQYSLTPKYQSPLARAQRQEDILAMDRFEIAVSQIANVSPGVLDLYDFDKAVTLRGDLNGVPSKLFRDEREVAQLRKDRAERQAQQAEAQAQGEQVQQ